MLNHAALEAAISIDAFADKPTLLGSFRRALSAAAEESALRATTARRVWPAIIERVLEANGVHWCFVADPALSEGVPQIVLTNEQWPMHSGPA
jgi:hypothetical protein